MQHLNKFLSMIEEKCGEDIKNLFQDDNNILILALKKSNLPIIEVVLQLYIKNKEKLNTKKVLKNRKGMNIFHLLMLNKTLSQVKTLSNFRKKRNLYLILLNPL